MMKRLNTLLHYTLDVFLRTPFPFLAILFGLLGSAPPVQGQTNDPSAVPAAALADIRALKATPSGSLVLAGQFRNQHHPDGSGTFLASATSTGELLNWQALGGTHRSTTMAMAQAPDGSLFWGGVFQGVLEVDLPGRRERFTSGGGLDMLVLRLQPNGDVLQAWRIGGPGHDILYDLAVDSEGHVFLAGSFEETIDVDPGGPGNPRWSKGGSDMLAIELDSLGRTVHVLHLGSTSDEAAFRLSLSPTQLILSGVFENSLKLSPRNASRFAHGGGTMLAAYDLATLGELRWAQVLDQQPAASAPQPALKAAFHRDSLARAPTQPRIAPYAAVAPLDQLALPGGRTALLLYHSRGLSLPLGGGHFQEGSGNLVMLIDSTGQVAWVRSLSDRSRLETGGARCLGWDGEHLLVAGAHHAVEALSPIPLTDVGSQRSGTDLFCLGYSLDGQAQSAEVAGSPGKEALQDMDVDANGQQLLAGSCRDCSPTSEFPATSQLLPDSAPQTAELLLGAWPQPQITARPAASAGSRPYRLGPNPAAEAVHVRLSAEASASEATYRWIDLLGQDVTRRRPLPADGRLNLPAGRAPVWLLELCIEGDCHPHRIRRQAMR